MSLTLSLPNGEKVLVHMPQGGGSGKSYYDPVKAHEYYMRTRHLKGRQPAAGKPAGTGRQAARAAVAAVQRGAHAKPGANPARDAAKQQISQRITELEGKLSQLEALIQRKEATVARNKKNPKVQAAQRSAQQKAKAKAASKQYRQAHKSALAAKAKAKAAANKHGGAAAGSYQQESKMSIKDLKMLATKVRGQLQAAKAKLAAL